MFANPKRPEISHRTIKLVVGLIAIFLAGTTNFLAGGGLESISASYHADGWARNIFVGSLFALAGLLLSYNGHSRREMILSKVAAVAALGVALFPCKCGQYDPIIPGIHGFSAAVMFFILAYMCYLFFVKARAKSDRLSNIRAFIYAVCGLVIIAAILVIAIHNLTRNPAEPSRVVFFGEMAGLVAFGLSWLVASHILIFIGSKERQNRIVD